MEDGPADLGLPLHLVGGLVAAGQVVLADRPVESQCVVSDVSGKRAVGSVCVLMRAGVDGDRQLDAGYDEWLDAAGRAERAVAGDEDGRVASFVSEEVVGVDASTGSSGVACCAARVA